MAYASDKTFYSNLLKKTVTKITKSEAKKIYESGGTVYLNTSKWKFDNPWRQPVQINKAYSELNFNEVVNGYSYYNTSKETGMVVHFYKEVKR
jgi:hypothetical protein